MAPAKPDNPSPGGDTRDPGPHPSFIQVAKPYVFQQKVQECMTAIGVNEAKEDNVRLQGVTWIDNVRKALQLPIRTYNTAVVYYHKFRLVHADNEYTFIDAAAAALFTACKIEDTLKKSKEILCAAYNLKLSPAEQLSADDAIFETHSKAIIGLERLMLEASGFDFRNRHPQKLLLKLAKLYNVDQETVGKTAYNMSLDLYRTFAPLKQTTPTMAIACLELSGRILDSHIEDLEMGKGYKKWRTTRAEVMETLLDLLDLYTHHRAVTIVGLEHPLEKFIEVRITLNQEASAHRYPRYTQWIKKKAVANGVRTSNGTKDSKDSRDETKDRKSPPAMGPASATGARSRVGERGRDGTVRFMLDGERARDEKNLVADYFKVEEEEQDLDWEDAGVGDKENVRAQGLEESEDFVHPDRRRLVLPDRN